MSATQQLNRLIIIEAFHYQKHEVVDQHSSLWGDFNFSLNGLLNLSVNQQSFLSPPNYGIWVPPRTQHSCIAMEQHTHYICIRIHPQLAQQLAPSCQTFNLSLFFKQTIIELLHHQAEQQSDYYQHLLQILWDQLLQAPAYIGYLPQSQHPTLQPILSQLCDPNTFRQSLQQILAENALSERHILRLSQQQLHLSLSEWRNRAKIIHAFHLLKQGQSIKTISYELGYNHSSSFIDFFKRHTGQTPNEMRYK